MNYIIKNGLYFNGRGIRKTDLFIKDGIIEQIGNVENAVGQCFDASNLIVSPGFIDMHVHLREPGFEQKETILGGTAAAAMGGFTTVCTMPNIYPCPDSSEHIAVQFEAIKRSAVVNVIPAASISRGQKGIEPSDIEELSHVCAFFSDDGKGVQGAKLMRLAMEKVKSRGQFISAHCEDESLLCGGSVHEGYAEKHGMRGISSRSEWEQVKRDIELVRETDCRYHICHISTKESLELVRRAKVDGLPVTCEVTPHHIVLCEDDILSDDGKYKMNPPLRSAEDRRAILAAIKDGTIDCIATDHAPHTEDEKSKGLEGSAFGVVGLETAFSICHTYLVKQGEINLEHLLYMMSYSPAKLLGKRIGAASCPADLCFIDPCEKYIIDSRNFAGKGKSTPFDGFEVQGKIKATMCGGNFAYRL